MSDENQVSEQIAEIPAPEAVETASTATDAAPSPEGTPVEAAKTFTQEELDAAIGKRLAREQRKWEREQQFKATEPARPAVELKHDNFDSTEAYADALAVQKAEKLIQQREMQKAQSEAVAVYHDREEDARAKYDDFDQVAYNPRLPVTDVMAATIQQSDIGPDLAYYLGSNPKEADRISRLQPFLQAKELGRLEVKLSSEPAPAKKVTTAPAPISPVTPSSKNAPSYDTTDPRSAKSMSPSEWIAADRERQKKAWEAKNR